MIDRALGLVAPHTCKGCDKLGRGLCHECFFDIVDSGYDRCISCGILTTNDSLCRNCRARLPFERAFVVGERHNALKRLVGDFKFNSERGHAYVIADLLNSALPILPDDTVIIPIPTIAPHIRRRGFGHTELIAKILANKRHLACDRHLLLRANNSVQHGLSIRERQKQSRKAFRINNRKTIPSEVLLVDDIYTTGATIISASKLLKQTGVKTINVAIVARQTKD